LEKALKYYSPLSHGAPGEGSNVLKWSSLRGSGGNNDGVLHSIVLLESLDELGNGGTLLADGDVDAVKLLGLVIALVPTTFKYAISLCLMFNANKSAHPG
jgi:hypothetical protein